MTNVLRWVILLFPNKGIVHCNTLPQPSMDLLVSFITVLRGEVTLANQDRKLTALRLLVPLLFSSASFFSNGMEQYKSKDYVIAVHFSKTIAPNGNTFM